MAGKDGHSSGKDEKGGKYRLLGASGLVEDEDGNLLNAGDLTDAYSMPEPGSPRADTWAEQAAVKTESAEPDWASLYDPRYCGSSREDYIARMSAQYHRNHVAATTEEPTTADWHAGEPTHKAPSTPSDATEPETHFGVQVTKRALVFYAIGLLLFLGYVVLLIHKLVTEIIHLFSI